jgi:orotate phosphoribosyltransferase
MSPEALEEARQWLRAYIEYNCIYRVPYDEEPLPGKEPDVRYTWQFYLRRGLFNNRFLGTVGSLFWEQFKDLYAEEPFQIMGLETGSTPLIVGIVMTAPFYGIDVNAVSIRAERKKYGLKNRFEGVINYHLPVMIVDDMCNSKTTLLRAMKYCVDEGLHIYKYGFAIVNKDVDGTHSDHDKYIGEGYEIKSLFNISEFILDHEDYLAFLKQINFPKSQFVLERFKG